MNIALTFDDGPNTSITPQVLSLLEEHDIPASFFLIGQNITDESAPMVLRALSLGCDIENHSLTHRPMDAMSAEEIHHEIDACTRRIIEVTGIPPRFFRPPYIAVSPLLFREVPLTFICGIGCNDWIPEVSAQERAARVLSDPKDGDLFLLHDSLGNVNTVEALHTIIPELKRRGFRFVTCRQLFNENNITPVPGRLYSNVFQTQDRI